MSSSVINSATRIRQEAREFASRHKGCIQYVSGLLTPTIVNSAGTVASTAITATGGAYNLASSAATSMYASGYLGYAIACPTTLAAVTGIGYLCRQMGKRPAFKEHGRNIIHQLKSSPGITDATRIALDTIKPVAAGKIAIKMETQNRKRGNSEIPSNLDVLRRINPRLAGILEREITEASCDLVETIPADPAPATAPAASASSSRTFATSSSDGFYTFTLP